MTVVGIAPFFADFSKKRIIMGKVGKAQRDTCL
jgi:hypothetical protein